MIDNDIFSYYLYMYMDDSMIRTMQRIRGDPICWDYQFKVEVEIIFG